MFPFQTNSLPGSLSPQAEHRERLSELKQRIEQGKDLVADELDRIASARQHREEATHDLDMVANSLQRQVRLLHGQACSQPATCRQVMMRRHPYVRPKL